MYNNPYTYNYIPYNYHNYNVPQRTNLFSSLFTIPKIKWSNILNNTQKTLNVINQAIPVYYQIKPIYNNAKTMFRMVNAIKSEDITEKKEDIKKNTDSTPVFFL